MKGIKLDALPQKYREQAERQINRKENLVRQPKIMPEINQEDSFISACKSVGLPIPIKEYKFHPTRKWKIDWAWPNHLIALEVEGAIWTQGRHTRGSGFLKDMEKYNELAVLGWRLIRTTPIEIKNLHILETLERIFKIMS